MNRRNAILKVSALGFGLSMWLDPTHAQKLATSTSAKATKTKADWKGLLTPLAYAVLFEDSTEAAGTSALDTEKRNGTYICAACYTPLFTSAQKFDSGTGWPSFFDAIPETLGQKRDFKLILPRTEYHCKHCAGHQGHVFSDGPKPTGLRYCNNGAALQFVLSTDKLPDRRA